MEPNNRSKHWLEDLKDKREAEVVSGEYPSTSHEHAYLRWLQSLEAENERLEAENKRLREENNWLRDGIKCILTVGEKALEKT